MDFPDPDSDFLRQIAFSRSANLVDPLRVRTFDARFPPVAHDAESPNLGSLVRTLPTGHLEHLHCAVAEAMTLHETSFFRDQKLFDVLRETILPRLIAANSDTRRLRIWSAGASTGQEAYSVAMLICEHFPNLADWDVQILGTDISSEVIDYAKQGRYRRPEVNCGLAARLLLKYFEREGEDWEIAPSLRSMCRYQHADLCKPMQNVPAFDLVMLRNVLLYLPPQDRSDALQAVHRRMTRSAYLVLGTAEQAEDSTDLFQTQLEKECYFYRSATRS
jgi:chemotaxis protein methyltransferase CheR